MLNDVNLHIRAGETVAFVGPSGAGKSTLIALLPRFYEVDGGSITIDGHDIRDLTLKSLRQQIGVVQQDVFLFGGTVREKSVTATSTPPKKRYLRRRGAPGLRRCSQTCLTVWTPSSVNAA